MNKKFSTLLTAGLLVAGSLTSSAWAEQISSFINTEAATAVESGKQYLVGQTYDGVLYVYGFKLNDEGKLVEIVSKATDDVDAENLGIYAWNISETKNVLNPTQYFYSFSNVGTGKALRVNQATSANDVEVVTDPSTGDGSTYKNFAFDGYHQYPGQDNDKFLVVGDLTNWNYLQLHFDDQRLAFTANATDLPKIKFYEITEQGVTDATLNALYNHAGFSFDMNKTWDGKTRDIENIFDQRMIALDVKEDVKATNEQTDADKWGFPKGTYFVTEHPAGAAYSDLGTNADRYAYLKACTFIVLSSTESWEVTAADRGAGKGFKLVEMTGNQLYKYMGTATANKVSGDEVSVYNACFQVSGVSTKSYPYAINNAEFRYLAKENPETAAEKVHSKAAVSLTVKKIGSTYYLTTENSAAKSYIFKFGESGIVKGIDLLKTDGAAVYNIRFVNGYYDYTQQDKYLTVGLAEGDNDISWDLVAKGEALAQDVLATPAYQFIITKVNGNNVTFTNRETGTSFTTKLFDEGNGTYSLATAENYKLFIANINRSSYAVTVDNGETELNQTLIELTESEVDPYAGFWNVADGTTVTLGFSRDVNNTSNIVYAYAAGNPISLVNSLDKANLTDDVYEATQWELNAIRNGVINIKRDYVYNNNDKVAVEPFGDVVSVQKYIIWQVEDAEETGYVMKWKNNDAPDLVKYTSLNPTDYYEYVIRENADGSVSIMTANSVVANVNANVGGVSAYSGHIQITTTDNKTYSYSLPKAYTVAKKAADVKTYLLQEAPYNAWNKDGYVSIQTEIGNYLSMNENNDGIVVDNDATPYYLHITDEDAVAPSFFISKSLGTMHGERLFMFNAIDSIGYQMVGDFNPKYQWSKNNNKIIFKTAVLNETADTLALTVKGEVAKYVADKQNNKENVWAGLDRFKWQVVEAEDGHYLIRQNNNDVEVNDNELRYLTSINEKLTWGTRDNATHFKLAEVDGPTANDAIAAEAGVQVIGGQGVVTVQGAAGKVITVANILGQTIANQVATSDNVTIAAPAGVVVVAVDGEATKVVVK